MRPLLLGVGAIALSASEMIFAGAGAPPRPVQAETSTRGEAEQIAPGVTFQAMRFTRGGSPFSAQVLEVDPRVPAVNILPVHALDKAAGKEMTSSMAKRFGAVAAVNGGYFEVSGNHAGASDGVYLWNGEVFSGGANRSALVFCREAKYREQTEIDVVDFRGAVTSRDGSRFQIAGMNRSPRAGELVVYTPALGASTKTTGSRTEVAVDAKGRVQAVNKGADNAIPKGGFVLSGTGEAASWLEKNAAKGARLRIETSLQRRARSASGCKPENIIGAGPRLVEGGVAKVTEERFNHARQRHPRTAFAVTGRGTFLLYTVDGRQPSSAGMTLQELADELISLGAVEAINLDGGGSTTMVVKGAIRNSPSDRRERPVSDGLLVFSIPDNAALGALIEHLTPGQIQPALAEKLRKELGKAGADGKKVKAVGKLARKAPAGEITAAAAMLIQEAAESVSKTAP